jgi:CheY-like chemotaxis protein
MMKPFSVTQQNRAVQIIVVDDIPDNQYLIQVILQDEGYQISFASSGHLA